MKTAHIDLQAALALVTVEDVLYVEGVVEHFGDELTWSERSRIVVRCLRRAADAYRAGHPAWAARLARCAKAAKGFGL